MRPTPARRRFGASPALIAALTCGTLGGGLVGVGALGFDRVGASASAVCVATEPDPLGPASAGSGTAPPAGALAALGSLPADAPTPTPTGVDAEGNRCTPDTVPSARAFTAKATDTHDDDKKHKKHKKKRKHKRKDAGGDKALVQPVLPTPAAPDPTPAPPEPSSSPTPSPSPSPSPSFSPEPTAAASPEPSPSPSPSPVLDVDIATSPGPEPTADPDPTASPTPTADPGEGPVVLSVQGGKISRPEVITRSISWVTQKVPYSQSRWWTDANGTYRQDCSGMVSMAWHLSQRTNYWTGNLATVSYRIPSDSLKPGDILLRPRQHTLIFAGWADEAHTSFNLYEEYGTGHPARYALNASLAHYLDRGFGTYRYDNIVAGPLGPADVPVTPGPVATQSPDPDAVLGPSPSPDPLGTPSPSPSPVLSPSPSPTLSPSPSPSPLVDATAMEPMSISGVQWTPELADGYEPEAEAPPAESGAMTPLAVADLPVADLVAAQRALDDAVLEAGRRAAAGHSSGNDLMAAGVVLLALAFPFGIAVRAGAWSPTSGVTRRDPADKEV